MEISHALGGVSLCDPKRLLTEGNMRSTVSFTLEVRITGICLFVPEPNADPPRVTVLTPQTNDSDKHEHGQQKKGSAIDVHRSVLIYETQFGGGPCDDSTNKWCLHELAGTELRLANGSAPHASVPGVYQLNRPPYCLRMADANAGSAQGVEAKVTLGSGYCEHVPPGARFLVDGERTRMPYEVHWVIPDMLDSELTLRDLDTGKPIKTVALNVSQGDRVVLYVRCVPDTEKWPDTKHSDPNGAMRVEHFSAFGRLLVPRHCPISIPEWQDDPNDKPFGASLTLMQPTARLGNPYTCMPAQTEPGP
jgi:hypothetical protein